MKRLRHTVILTLFIISALFGAVAPLRAQQPESLWSIEQSLWKGSNIGEDYTVELSGGLWEPTPVLVASSEQFGILGSNINFGDDLGLTRTQHPEFRATFKPGRKHKIRVSVTPIQYSQEHVLERRLVFQGIAYDIGVPVASTLRWEAWRLGYEYDVISRSRGYFGLIFEAKYTRLQAELNSEVDREFIRAQAPIPALGGIMRLYPTRFTPITAEFTAFKLPTRVGKEDYRAQYIDFDVFGTINLSRMFGVNVGYRAMDFSYLVARDTADLKLDGIYVSGTFRY